MFSSRSVLAVLFLVVLGGAFGPAEGQGVDPQISRLYQADPLADYPMGITIMGSESQNGWDWIKDASTVLTVRHPSYARSTQFLVSYDSEMYLRKPASEEEWNDWVQVVTEEEGSGHVGIGTDDPSTALEVDGGVTVTEGINPSISRPEHTDPISTYPTGVSLTGSESEGDWNWIKDASTVLTLRSPSSNPQRSSQLLMSYDNEMYLRSPAGDGSWRDWVQLVTEQNGKVGIGTSSPSEALTVRGNVLASEVIVEPESKIPDYVFEEGYDLPSLEEVSHFIDRKGHLPAVPSAESVEQNGLRLGEMDATLLRKVEELTLYAIEQKQRADSLAPQVQHLRNQDEVQRTRLDRLENQNDQLRKRLDQLEQRLQPSSEDQ
jgi:hypothetical protein